MIHARAVVAKSSKSVVVPVVRYGRRFGVHHALNLTAQERRSWIAVAIRASAAGHWR